jgi:hypothetical protein
MKFHFCFLNWSKWSEKYAETYTRTNSYIGVTIGTPSIVSLDLQKRNCEVCNKEQVREIIKS